MTNPAFECRIPFVPGSKKNAYRQRRVPFRGANGKYHGRPVYSALAQQEGSVRAILCAEMARRGLTPLPKDHAVSVEMSVHEGPRPEDNYVVVYAFPLGPKRRCGLRGRRPDLDGVVTTILDAMSRAVFADDGQVTRLTARRHTPGEVVLKTVQP